MIKISLSSAKLFQGRLTEKSVKGSIVSKVLLSSVNYLSTENPPSHADLAPECDRGRLDLPESPQKERCAGEDNQSSHRRLPVYFNIISQSSKKG
jgi:hypothetical protein